MLLHVLRHVDARHRVLVVEQVGGERLGKLGLADAGGAEEHERADRPVGVLETGTGASHGLGDGLHRLALADDALADLVLHAQQLLALALQHLVDRNAGPARHDLRDVVGRHGLLDHRALAVFARLRLLELLLQLRNVSISQFAGALELALALRDGELVARLVELLLEVCGQAELLLLGAPRRGERGGLFFEVGKLLLEPAKPVLRRLVLLQLQRLALDLELHDAAVDLVERLGLGIDLHSQPRRGLVDEVDRLVGQEAVGDVAVGQRRRRDQRGVRDAHLVVLLVLLLDAAQDRDRVLDRGLADEHRLEAPRKCGVLLYMLAVFVERGRADAMQLAARQRRLQEVRRVHRAVRLAGADQRVHLVDEQDDAAGGAGDFGEHGLQPLLELAAVFRAGDQRAHVERHQLLVLQRLRHVAIDDAQRQSFDDCRLADARLADQHGVVLGAPRQHLDGAADLVVAADHRIELARAGVCREVARVFLQRIIGLLGTCRIGGAALADVIDDLVQRLRRDAGFGENVRGLGRLLHGQRLQQPLDGDEAVAGFLGQIFRGGEDLGERLRQIELPVAAFDLRLRFECRLDAELDVARASAGALDQRGSKAFVVVDQDLEEMFGGELLVVARQRRGLRGLDEAADAFRIFFRDSLVVSVPSPARLRHRISLW